MRFGDAFAVNYMSRNRLRAVFFCLLFLWDKKNPHRSGGRHGDVEAVQVVLVCHSITTGSGLG